MNYFFNTYSTALFVFVATWVVLWFIKQIIISQLTRLVSKTKTDIDDAVVSVLGTAHPFVLGAVSLAFAIKFTAAPAPVIQAVNTLLLVALVYQAIIAIGKIADIIITRDRGKKVDAGKKAAMSFLSGMVKFIIWTIGILLVLSNLGINITSLIAGLGIGGVAVAFALQKILADLFNSFAIFLDKPFEVGDYILVDRYRGKVEKIGIKTTRIRSIEGEELVVPNTTLTSAWVQNFKKMKERRGTISIGVLYETSSALLEEIPEIIKSIVTNQEKTRFERVHLKSLGDSAVVFELVYFVLSPEYNDFMNVNQNVLLEIKKTFDKKGIGFAYPTQTLYVKN